MVCEEQLDFIMAREKAELGGNVFQICFVSESTLIVLYLLVFETCGYLSYCIMELANILFPIINFLK